MGLRLPGRLAARRRRDPAPPRQGRGRRRESRAAGDGPRRRLQGGSLRPPMGGVRGRLTVTLVALVVLTAGVLGIGSYLFVDNSLHQRLLDQANSEARFDLSVLIPSRLAG